MQSDRIDVLVRLAKSSSWEDRAYAAVNLAGMVDSGPAARAILDLLRDEDNTAVGQAALDALLSRGDERSADILFEGVATADDDMADHLLYFIARDHSREPGRSRLVGFARRRANGLPGPIQDGAIEVLEALGADTPRDG
jgi:hypothetical protein